MTDASDTAARSHIDAAPPDGRPHPLEVVGSPHQPTAAFGCDPGLVGLSWPRDQLGQALEVLALRSGLRNAAGKRAAIPAIPPFDASVPVAEWLEWAAGRLAIEAEAVEFPLPELEHGLLKACPMVHALHDGSELRFLLLLRATGRSVVLIGPDLRLYRRPVGMICAAATARSAVPLVRHLDSLLQAAKVAPGRKDRVRSAMLREQLATRMVGGSWILHLPATAPFLAQLKHAGLINRLGWVIVLLLGVYLAEIGSWALIGAAALDGRLDLAWLVAWLLLVVSNIPPRLGAAWLEAGFALDLGRILKKRLLAGALCMNIDAVRHQGVGQLLGRVMESQALESLVLNGGMAVIVAILELMFAAWILATGAGGYWHLLALLVWLAATAVFCRRYYRRLRAWSAARLNMTHELIEHMVGHRTRLAQEWPHRRDHAEDRSMRDYLELSRELDNAITPVAVGAAGGWAIVALIGLAPAFIMGTASPAGLAISVGGILLANRAFSGISQGVTSLSHAAMAWSLVSNLFRAAHAPIEPISAVPPGKPAVEGEGRMLIDASEVVFRYRPEGRAVLQGLDLTVHHGEKVLLEGASGGGKSTLAALLTGLRLPDSGLLLLDGLDRPTLGSRWHQMAAAAPQFHENHILASPLAFNLLMGRVWPPSEADLRMAQALCVELGLGPLLSRMPSGLMQQVGETGWQLSHGERSRIFLARALLQDVQLTVLDESFAALDPETLKVCLKCVVARTGTLVVIAHP
jgi:ATP-binding cassette subfamily B protein